MIASGSKRAFNNTPPAPTAFNPLPNILAVSALAVQAKPTSCFVPILATKQLDRFTFIGRQKMAKKTDQNSIIRDLFTYVVSGFNPGRSKLRYRLGSQLPLIEQKLGVRTPAALLFDRAKMV